MQESVLTTRVNPGIHPFALQKINDYFDNDEKEIARKFGSEWYVTKADKLDIGASSYKYILIKSPPNMFELFNISSEIIVVFSDYEKFEPRTFDTFDNIKDRLESGRVENLCGVIVSRDNNVATAIKAYNNSAETRTIIPFSYYELVNSGDNSYLFRNKFQQYFYSRDLFAFDDALKTDLYFFGRNQLVMEIIDKHLVGQNSGLFGLRKTGKTSIIYDVKRKIQTKNAIGVFISCQDPEMSMGTWVDSIYYIVKCIYNEMGWDTSDLHRENFTELTTSELLLATTNRVYETCQKTTLLMFDEVEHITYGKAASIQWRNELQSVFFWKAVRSAFQTEKSKFTYCIAGTNPICIEYPTIEQVDNPIFCGVTPKYIPGFDVEQTRTMVRKLGRIMGITFDDILYSKMTEEYGGHPFLIRHLCSYIASKYPNRPVKIDRVKYNSCKEEFNRTQGKYFDMLLDVLKGFYPNEYEMLEYISVGDTDTFDYFAKEDYSLVQHLLGYGIIQETDGIYDFKMDVIKNYVLCKSNISQQFKTKEEKWSHLCTRRGNFEIELRKVVKNVLKLGLSFQGVDSREYVMNKLYNDAKSKRNYVSYSYDDLFDPQKSKIYLKGLTTLVNGQWALFASLMGDITQEDFNNNMGILNVEGRFDAHAKIPDDSNMILFDGAIDKLESIISNYNQMFYS